MMVIHLASAAAAADAEWFERNPGRLFRIRGETLSERSASPWYALTGPDPSTAGRRVIVASVPDVGVRLRVSVAPSSGVPAGDPGDGVLRRAFLVAAPPPVADLYVEHVNSLGPGAGNDAAAIEHHHGRQS